MMMMIKQEEIQERLHVMRHQEDSTYTCSDYLLPSRRSRKNQDATNGASTSSTTSSNGVTVDTIDSQCRFKMTEWCYTVIDYIKFRRETVSIAMNYLDRFLCSSCPRALQVLNSRREYQLASMTTLFMAIKINEPIVVDITLMTELSKGVYKPCDFKNMETDILFGLNWYVNGPTAQSFALHLLTLMQQKQELLLSMGVSSPSINYDELLQLVSYKIELAVGEYKLMTQKPSVIATAAIWSSMDDLHIESSGNSSISSSIRNPMTASLKHSLFDIASNLSIQMDCLQETKDCIARSKLEKSMKMRSNHISLSGIVQSSLSSSPRSSAASSSSSVPPRSNNTTSSSMYSSSQNVQCTKGDAQHCSPICISKRNVVGHNS